MINKIVKKSDIVKRNLELAFENVVFKGSPQANVDAKDPLIVKKSNGEELAVLVEAKDAQWTGTKAYKQHWNEIKIKLEKIRKDKEEKVNVAQFPDDYYDLIEAISLDITRRRIQEADYTALVTQEITRFEFSKSVNLKEFLGFVGEFQENNLAGDAVPLIEQKTGAIDSVTMEGYALGHVRSLEDVLYNLDIYSMQKVNEAYVRAFVGLRNDKVFGPMIALTDAAGWDASQTVAADATSGATYEEKMYRTIDKAIETIGLLHDFQTRQEIDLTKLVIATGRNVDARRINRAINGQIDNSKGINSNRTPLEIDEVWLYKGDNFFFGKKQVTYKGIGANKAYLFVPGPSGAPNWTLVKRPLTTQASEGDALTLGQDKESRYFVQTKYNDEFYGTSSSNTVIAADTSQKWGYIVEVNLPTM